MKGVDGEAGNNARQALRFLEGLRLSGDLVKGVALPSRGTVRLEVNHVDADLPQGLDPNSRAGRVLKVCRGLMDEGTPATLVSRDMVARIRAQMIGVPAEEVPLAIIQGPTGTARTFYALAAGLEQVLETEERPYRKILVCRPNAQFDADIGFLPGSEQEKISPPHAAHCGQFGNSAGSGGEKEEYVWQLSGGQTHLLALAGAVSLQPDILILDEPIAQLDPVHADRIYEVLRKLNEHHGKTIIVIEHHTEYIADYCKHVMLMRDGQIRWLLPTEDALQRVEELEACNIFPPQVTQAAYRLRQQGKFPDGRVLPTTVEEGKTAFSHLRYIPGTPRRVPEVSAEAAVSFQDVSLSYRSVKGNLTPCSKA